MKKFKFIDLFAGVGGLGLPFRELGGECVFTSEWDKYAKKTYIDNHNGEVNGDITKIEAEDIPPHDLLVGGFPCFVAGTLVNTESGLLPIEKVKKGQKVLTHLNRYQQVIVPMVKYAKKGLLVKIPGVEDLKVTHEHPFYIYRDNKLQWVNAEDLKKTDFALINLNKENKVYGASIIEGKYIAKSIGSVVDIKLDQLVYNIEVETDNSYCVNNVIVHNCQAFSCAGKKGGFDDTRGTLFFDVMRIAKHHKPKVMLLENVRGLVSHDKGNTFKTILKTLDEVGYTVFHKVLYAKDFGLPQNRPRIFLVCIRKDLKIDFEFPESPKIKTKLGDILDRKVDPKYTISDKLWLYLQNRKEQQKAKGNGFGFTLFTRKSVYVNTMSARYYKDGSEILIAQKGKNPRRLTPRESARLQGFPDDFKITVSDTQFYKQMGNSVAVNVIRAIAKKIVKLL